MSTDVQPDWKMDDCLIWGGRAAKSIGTACGHLYYFRLPLCIFLAFLLEQNITQQPEHHLVKGILWVLLEEPTWPQPGVDAGGS